MVGVLFFVGYFTHIQRISKKLGYSIMAIFFIFSCCICGAIYQKNVAFRRNAELEAKRIQQESQVMLRPSLPYFMASDIARSSRTTPKEQMLSVLRDKQLRVNQLYLINVYERDNNVLYAFADNPTPNVSNNSNVFFFGKALNKTVEEKLNKIPKGKSVFATLEFVDLQNVGDDLGFPVTAFIVLVYDASF